MAIFSKPHQPTNATIKHTTIADGCRVEGIIQVNGSLVIDGSIEGQVQVNGTLRIGKTGCITGNVQAKQIIIAGKLSGEVQTPLMEITESGDFDGKAEVGELVVAKGGRFSGISERIEQAQVASLADKKISSQGSAQADKPIAIDKAVASKKR